MYDENRSRMVDVDRVFLDQNNPRHESFDSQVEAINYLCANEKIAELAEDIVENGLNPLDLFALIKEQGSTYFSAEGNRRLCAIKLLNDPDLAPSKYREKFATLSARYVPIASIVAVEFEDREEVRLWLDRIHAGQDNGRGRRQWNSEQKSRNSVYSKNDLALSLLDAAERLHFITKVERKGRLSTVQRYLSNPLVRNALGLVLPDSAAEYKVNLPDEDFIIVLSYFINDLKHKKISTRANSGDMTGYANKLTSLEGFSGERIKPGYLSDLVSRQEDKVHPKSQPSERGQTNDSGQSNANSSSTEPSESPAQPSQREPDPSDQPLPPIQPVEDNNEIESSNPERGSPESPQPPSKPNKLLYNKELQEKLKAIPSYKLDSMYYTLCTVFLRQHTPMLYVGVWSFVESLTALCGRSEKVDFQAFLSKERLSSLGVSDKAEQKAIRQSLQRVSEFGNSTKHHKDGAGFNSAQLANDFEILQVLLLSLADAVATGKEL